MSPRVNSTDGTDFKTFLMASWVPFTALVTSKAAVFFLPNSFALAIYIYYIYDIYVTYI